MGSGRRLLKFNIAAMFAIVLWGAFPWAISTITQPDTFAVVVVVQLLGLLTFLPIILTRGEVSVSIGKVPRHLLPIVVISGIFNAAEYFCFFAALRHTNPVVPTMIFETWVVWSVLINLIFFHARLDKRQSLWIIPALIGACIVVAQSHRIAGPFPSFNAWGILALLAALCAGIKASLNTRIAHDYSRRTHAFTASLMPHFLTVQIAVLVYFIVFLAAIGTGYSSHAHALFNPFATLAASSLSDISRMALIGIIIIGLGNPAFIYALQHRPTESHTAVFFLIPVVATLVLVLIGHAQINYLMVAGGALTLVSVVRISTWGKNEVLDRRI